MPFILFCIWVFGSGITFGIYSNKKKLNNKQHFFGVVLLTILNVGIMAIYFLIKG